MGLKQRIGQEALQIRNAVIVSDTTKTLTLADMESGTVTCTSASETTITLPAVAGPPFFIVAAGGVSVLVSALYDGALVNTIVTKLSGLCHYVNGYGWFCISAVASA